MSNRQIKGHIFASLNKFSFLMVDILHAGQHEVWPWCRGEGVELMVIGVAGEHTP